MSLNSAAENLDTVPDSGLGNLITAGTTESDAVTFGSPPGYSEVSVAVDTNIVGADAAGNDVTFRMQSRDSAAPLIWTSVATVRIYQREAPTTNDLLDTPDGEYTYTTNFNGRVTLEVAASALPRGHTQVRVQVESAGTATFQAVAATIVTYDSRSAGQQVGQVAITPAVAKADLGGLAPQFTGPPASQSGTFMIGGISINQAWRVTEWWADQFLFQTRGPGLLTSGQGGPLYSFGGDFGSWALDPSWDGELSGELFVTPFDTPGPALSPKIISLSDGTVDAGAVRVTAGCSWGGRRIDNLASGQDDLVFLESGNAPTGQEEGMWVSFHQSIGANAGVWTVPQWLAYTTHDSDYVSYVYSVDLTDHGVPVGGAIDAVGFANIIRGDQTDTGTYGTLTVEGDGTGPILISGDLDPVVLVPGKTDPDPSYVVALRVPV